VEKATRQLWLKQNQHVGDRERLFHAVADALSSAKNVLYPGSYVDVAPSFVWPSVTYVDVDRRAARFFADQEGVEELLSEHGVDAGAHSVRFIHGDYSDELNLDDESFDLVISLYAGLISEHCIRYLRTGGHLLVNSSHGDAAMASINPRYQLTAVVRSRSGDYSVDHKGLEKYLIPKRDVEVTAELIHETGRGVAYTKSPFAYLFELIG